MNTYHAFYKGREIEVQASTSYAAQLLAAKQFGARKSHEVTVIIVALGETAVIHRPQDVCA